MLKIMMSVLLATGLSVTGCMTEPETAEPAESAASQEVGVPTGVRCSNKAWRVNFYSDATLTTRVGAMSCTCWGPELLDGVTSNFTTLAFERVCDLN